MPMLFARRYPDDIARTDFVHRSALGLNPAYACNDVQRLSQRMCVPGGARPGLERYPVRGNPRRRLGCDDRILPYRAGEIFFGGPACRPRTGEMDIHGVPPCTTVPVGAGYFFEAA